MRCESIKHSLHIALIVSDFQYSALIFYVDAGKVSKQTALTNGKPQCMMYFCDI